MAKIHEVTYDEDGTIKTVLTIDPEYAPRNPPAGMLFTTEIPDDPDILHHYKIQNGVFVYDPVEVKEEVDIPYPYRILNELRAAQNDTDALAVDQEYRLTLLELGV